MNAKRIARGILWVIWWTLKGSILVGILTRKIKSEKKRNYIVIAFDIAVIVVFIWFALTQRSEFMSGYNACAVYLCNNQPSMAKMCENITNSTYGVENIIHGVNITEKYCGINGTGGCFY